MAEGGAKNKADYPLAYERGEQLTMQEVIDEVYEQTGGDAIATTDVGSAPNVGGAFLESR